MTQAGREPRAITVTVLRKLLHESNAAVLDEQELEDWIARRWVQPEEFAGEYLFEEIDVARVRLLRVLRHDLQLDVSALPVVLLLLDQLHAAHRALRAASRTDGWLPEL